MTPSRPAGATPGGHERPMSGLTLERVEVRPVLVPLGRPVVSRVGLYEHWPLILIDLFTDRWPCLQARKEEHRS